MFSAPVFVTCLIRLLQLTKNTRYLSRDLPEAVRHVLQHHNGRRGLECTKNSLKRHETLIDALQCDNAQLSMMASMTCALCHAAVPVSTLLLLAPVRPDLC